MKKKKINKINNKIKNKICNNNWYRTIVIYYIIRLWRTLFVKKKKMT